MTPSSRAWRGRLNSLRGHGSDRRVSRFGRLLKEWRAFRGLSQLELALAADTSQRHLSFIESGRAQPSEALVTLLSEVLGQGLRDRNALLVAAGYAPRFGENGWNSDALAGLRHAARLMLERHEPDPAFVLDAASNVLDANQAALALLGSSRAQRGHLNLVELVFEQGPVRDALVNWEQVAGYLLARLRDAAMYRGPTSNVQPFYERAMKAAAASNLTLTAPTSAGPLLPISFRVGGEVRHWYSTVTTFGAPQDALLEEIAIELFHPYQPG